MAKRNKYFADKCKNLIKQKLKRAENDFMKCARIVNTDIHADVQKMYRTFIEQFYHYKTEKYRRHFELTVGTRQGENLTYPVAGIRINNRASHSPKLYVELWASEMSNDPRYEYHTPEGVLDYVMQGIRFATGKGYVMSADTQFHYYSKDMNFNYRGSTIQGAFDLFNKRWKDISSDMFYKRWDKYVKQWQKEERDGGQ